MKITNLSFFQLLWNLSQSIQKQKMALAKIKPADSWAKAGITAELSTLAEASGN